MLRSLCWQWLLSGSLLSGHWHDIFNVVALSAFLFTYCTDIGIITASYLLANVMYCKSVMQRPHTPWSQWWSRTWSQRWFFLSPRWSRWEKFEGGQIACQSFVIIVISVADDVNALAIAAILQYSVMLIACGMLLKSKENILENTGWNRGWEQELFCSCRLSFTV